MDERSLLRAVLERPDDDGPRLVYADWLLERGDPRGEYIALQCKLETLGDDDAAREALVRRADELLDRHGERWFGGNLVTGTEHWRNVIEFRRGFACSVQTSSLGAPLAVLDHEPIEHLDLVIRTHWGRGAAREQVASARDAYLAPFAREIAADPRLARLRSLLLDVRWGAVAIAALLSGPYWQALRDLAVIGSDCAEFTIRAIARCDLPRLEGLRFDSDQGDQFGDPRLPLDRSELVTAPTFARLRRLTLRSLGLVCADMRHLAASPVLTQLTELDLGNRRAGLLNRIRDAGARTLAEAANLGAVERLELDGNQIGSGGLAALLQSRAFPALRTLSVRGNQLDDSGLRAFASSAGVAALQVLELGGDDGITDEGIAALARAPRLAQLTTLRIQRCPIGDRAATALARSPYVHDLQELDLTGCTLDDPGAVMLAESAALARARLALPTDKLDERTRAMVLARPGNRARHKPRTWLDARASKPDSRWP